MIYVDSCIAMYIVGKDHPNKEKILSKIERLLFAGDELVTSAEAFQEIIHRYKALKDFKHLEAAYLTLEELVFRVLPVTKENLDLAYQYAIQYRNLSSRDCLHTAVMKQHRCESIWSYDTAFETIPWMVRIE